MLFILPFWETVRRKKQIDKYPRPVCTTDKLFVPVNNFAVPLAGPFPNMVRPKFRLAEIAPNAGEKLYVFMQQIEMTEPEQENGTFFNSPARFARGAQIAKKKHCRTLSVHDRRESIRPMPSHADGLVEAHAHRVDRRRSGTLDSALEVHVD